MAIILPIATKFDDAGLKKAKSEFSSFSGTLKKGLQFAGIAVGVSAIVDVMQESVKAAALDIKSQKLLALQLHNTVGATKAQTKAAEDYISKLSMQVGIVDDDLRPALANAVRGTGSLAQGQKLLGIALDASAATGKPLNTVMQALIKANDGQTASLYKLAPELKKTKGTLDDFALSVKGAAEANADPFARMNVAVDSLKEQFGRLLLPTVVKFVDYLTNTVVPAVSSFLDDVGNPKTDAGKVFLDIKAAVEKTFKGVQDFFALFGGGDAMKGFGNVASSLVKMLPALLAFKGIMMLSSAGSSLKNLASAIGLLKGSPIGGLPGVPGSPASVTPTGTEAAATGFGGTFAATAKVIAASQVAAMMATDAARQQLNTGKNNWNIQVGGNMALPSGTKGDPTGLKSAFTDDKPKKPKGPKIAPAQYGSFMDTAGFDKGSKKPPTTINVTVQPGTSSDEVAKKLVTLLAKYDKANGTKIVTK